MKYTIKIFIHKGDSNHLGKIWNEDRYIVLDANNNDAIGEHMSKEEAQSIADEKNRSVVALFDAMDNLTVEDFNNIGYGEQISLSSEFVLYKYIEDDVIMINHMGIDGGVWEEVLQVLINADNTFSFEDIGHELTQ